MSDYKYSIEAKNVNKVFYKKSQQVKALIDFSIKIEKGTNRKYVVMQEKSDLGDAGARFYLKPNK